MSSAVEEQHQEIGEVKDHPPVWANVRRVGPIEAKDIACRLIAGSFRHDGETLPREKRPRFSIPTRVHEDDDCLLMAHIEQQATEVDRLKAAQDAAERERDHFRDQLEHVAEMLEPHWRGAGAPLEASWMITEIKGIVEAADDDRDRAEAEKARADALEARLRRLERAIRVMLEPGGHTGGELAAAIDEAEAVLAEAALREYDEKGGVTLDEIAASAPSADPVEQIVSWLRGWRETDPPEEVPLEAWRAAGFLRQHIADEIKRGDWRTPSSIKSGEVKG